MNNQRSGRSLLAAALTLPASWMVSYLSLNWTFNDSAVPRPAPHQYFAATLWIFPLIICLAGFGNLIRDTNRGYPPGRGSLAAVLLLLAIAPPVCLGFRWLSSALR